MITTRSFPGPRYIACMLLVILLSCTGSASGVRIFDIAGQRARSIADLLPELKKNRIIFIGENHDRQAHHQVQRDVIAALHQSGAQVAVGVEMFRKDSQEGLDRWVDGTLSPEEFQTVYDDNWNFPWPLYGDILDYARKEKIPVIGLNVPKEITRQVATGGFKSLGADQRESLPMVSCHVDKRYMDFIRESYGMHGHGRLDFTNFCEAQLVWDKAMAVNVLDYLAGHPNAVMVVIAGKGHAQKMGIPAQIAKRSALPVAVMLPRNPTGLISGEGDIEDADYLF